MNKEHGIRNQDKKNIWSWLLVPCSLFLILILFSSCHHKHPDVSNIHIQLHIDRFDQDLFSLDEAKKNESIASLQKKYGTFFGFYFEDFFQLWMQHANDTSWKDSLITYTKNPSLQSLYDSTEKKFSDLTKFNNELTQAVKYYRYYTHDTITPNVITLINGPGFSAFPFGEKTLCVSLDQYLGEKFSYYKFQQVPLYMVRKFKEEYLVSNCMDVLLRLRFQPDSSMDKLLDEMIFNGKIIYVKQQVLPDAPDSITSGFALKDLKWCDDNAEEIWQYFISHNLLYETDELEYGKYVHDGPNTTGMPEEAPGNIGSWVGWKIVSKYMKENSSVTVEQLLHETDSQKILTASKYKPVR